MGPNEVTLKNLVYTYFVHKQYHLRLNLQDLIGVVIQKHVPHEEFTGQLHRDGHGQIMMMQTRKIMLMTQN